MNALVPPIARLEAIDLDTLNECLEAWGHKMGPWRRPTFRGWFHALYHHDEPIAVTAAGDLIRERCGGFTRDQAIELARLCSRQPYTNRVMLRLWRELIFPDLCRAHGWEWVISYQDAVIHTGNLYRHDGWVRVAKSRSGTDQRSRRKGRNKVIWGWCPHPMQRRSREISGAT